MKAGMCISGRNWRCGPCWTGDGHSNPPDCLGGCARALNAPYAFPRGRMVRRSGQTTIYWGGEKCVAAHQGEIAAALLAGENPKWQFDEHERVIAAEKETVRQWLGITDIDWESVDGEALFAT